MTIAYSFIRFSSPEQAKGDSLRRQLEASERFTTERGLTLDSSFRDLGKSASKGEHVATGALGRFITLVDTGKIASGSWLIVEDMDRLDRRQVNIALKQFMSLLEAEITIHTMIDNQTYTLERINEDPTALILSILKMIAAHDYTAKLAMRITAKWQQRREAMRAGKGVPTNACPRWLQAIDGKFVERPDRVAIVKRIIAERHRGIGRHEIATRLNLDGVPTFHGGDGWHPSTIAMLVKNKALIGIYQPRRADGSEDGPEIEFYPRVISDDDFWRAQWSADNKLARGRKTKGFANLLSEICHCGRCAKDGKPGAGLIYLNTGKDQFLVCNKARRGLCDNRYHRTYRTLERELLSLLGLLDFSRLLDKANPYAERIAALEGEITDTSATIDRLLDDFSTNTPAAVSKRISALSAKVETLTVELVDAKRIARIAEAAENRDAYAEFQALIDQLPTMPDDEARKELRRRLAHELRRVIKSATADGTELTIRLRGTAFYKIELLIHRSTMDSLKLTSIESGRSFLFPRDVLFGKADIAGLFAGYVGQERRFAAG